MTYGEQPEFDPGAQWINNLSIVGGTTHLVNSIVKYASVAGSVYTLYESVIRAGELAQRQPTGPTYLSVSTETLMDGWTPPANPRTVPPAPRMLTAPEDIEKLAAQISKAKHPVVLTEGAGQEVETYEALVALCEKFALPVVEKPGALFANFPKDHPLYQGTDIKPFWNDMDLAIVVRARAPWYPPSNRPPKAVIAMVDEAPHNSAMVYQSHQADMYLEGNAAQTLRDLADAATVDKAAMEARRKEFAAAHDAMVEKRSAAQAAARKKTPIDPVWLGASLNTVLPTDTISIDEVTTHTALLRQHLVWNQPQSLFTRQGGLGQGWAFAGDQAGGRNGESYADRRWSVPLQPCARQPRCCTRLQPTDHGGHLQQQEIRRDAGHASQDVPGWDRGGDRRIPRHPHQRARLREGRRIRWRLRRAGDGSGKAPGCAEARPRSQPKRQTGDYRRDRCIDDTEGAVVTTPPFTRSIRNRNPEPTSAEIF
jgi:hypothetical protein